MSKPLPYWEKEARAKRRAEFRELRAMYRTGWRVPDARQADVIRRHWQANNLQALVAYCWRYRLNANDVIRKTPISRPVDSQVDKGGRAGVSLARSREQKRPNKKPNMSRKDYVKIAEAVRIARDRVKNEPCGINGAVDKVLEELVRVLNADNERFDAGRFARAAGGYHGMD